MIFASHLSPVKYS